VALSEPFDLLPDFPGWVTKFELRYRQEQSRTAGGRTIVKDMGSPLWQMAAQTKVLRPNDLDYWRARLQALENGLKTFWGYPLSRTYPIAHPKGSWPTGGAFDGVSASLASINANRKAIRVDDLPVGFKFSVGDFLSIAGDLHQVMEPATAAVGGLTPQFEVRPHLWPSVTVSDPAPAVSVYRPACLMAIVPGSISADAGLNGWGSVAFQAIEARL
jgi:hypothetical protein